MKTKSFFFDTANAQYINKTWDKISRHFNPDDVVGVTTNPNAMFKENLQTMSEWKQVVQTLCQLVRDIRGDNQGIVYIQGPNSGMNVKDILEFLRFFNVSESICQIGIKIPPFSSILCDVDQLDEFCPNVTGVADCSTALYALSYDKVRFVSIIPGRMEEKGIDAEQQIEYVNRSPNSRGRLITGSMRTVDGLKRAIYCDTIPTIGTRVWDSILASGYTEEMASFWTHKTKLETSNNFSPLVSPIQTDLSVEFFKQMDTCGELPYSELKR